MYQKEGTGGGGWSGGAGGRGVWLGPAFLPGPPYGPRRRQAMHLAPKAPKLSASNIGRGGGGGSGTATPGEGAPWSLSPRPPPL